MYMHTITYNGHMHEQVLYLFCVCMMTKNMQNLFSTTCINKHISCLLYMLDYSVYYTLI